MHGYDETTASTGANSAKASYKGVFYVEYPDGTKHRIIFPDMKLSGTMVGSRTLKFKGMLFVIDQKNDIISHVDMDPDERGFFKKMVSNKNTLPDHFRYDN
jgi:hypothetical protein